YAGGAWTGNGITSSSAAGVSGAHRTAVGYAEASTLYGPGPYPAVSGQTIDADTVLIRYVYAGDTNLDGVVNTQDFQALASHFNTSGTGWAAGDVNYDGVVNALDFNALASNFGQTLSAPSVGASLVPEPAALASIGVIGLLVSPGRRRRHAT